MDWQNSTEAAFGLDELEREPAADALFGSLPAEASKAKSYAAWSRDLVQWLYGSQTLELYKSPSLGETSKPGESERDFRLRLQQAGREKRDESVEKLRKAYAPKTAALEERIRRAEQAAEREKEQANQQKMQTAISVGATLLGAFSGQEGGQHRHHGAGGHRGPRRQPHLEGNAGRCSRRRDGRSAEAATRGAGVSVRGGDASARVGGEPGDRELSTPYRSSSRRPTSRCAWWRCPGCPTGRILKETSSRRFERWYRGGRRVLEMRGNVEKRLRAGRVRVRRRCRASRNCISTSLDSISSRGTKTSNWARRRRARSRSRWR